MVYRKNINHKIKKIKLQEFNNYPERQLSIILVYQ